MGIDRRPMLLAQTRDDPRLSLRQSRSRRLERGSLENIVVGTLRGKTCGKQWKAGKRHTWGAEGKKVAVPRFPAHRLHRLGFRVYACTRSLYGHNSSKESLRNVLMVVASYPRPFWNHGRRFSSHHKCWDSLQWSKRVLPEILDASTSAGPRPRWQLCSLYTTQQNGGTREIIGECQYSDHSWLRGSTPSVSRTARMWLRAFVLKIAMKTATRCPCSSLTCPVLNSFY